MSAFDWVRINNKYDLQLANRFAQHEFFKSFITKDNKVRTNEVAAIPILPSKSLTGPIIFIFEYFTILNLNFRSQFLRDLGFRFVRIPGSGTQATRC